MSEKELNVNKMLDFLKNLFNKTKKSDNVQEPAKVEEQVINQLNNKEEEETPQSSVEEIVNSLAENAKENEPPEDEMPESDEEHVCCICGAPDGEVNMVIKVSNNRYICDRCATMVHLQIDEINKYNQTVEQAMIDQGLMLPEHDEDEEKKKPELDKPIREIVPTPHEIKAYLDDYVIGQDEAKIKLSVAVYNHYKRIYQKESDDTTIEKSGALILGETGSGKTLLAKTIAQLLDLPLVICDCNNFTQAGYVGEDVETILSRLYQAADNDMERAQKGIVFLDEVDKIAKQGDSPSITKDVSGEGVQQALLKMLEGAKIKFTPAGGRKHPEQPMLEMDTTNILFICSGAFVGIEKRIENRLNLRTIGFDNSKIKKNVTKDNIIEYLTAEDVRAFGMIPEFVGRIPVITYVKKLTKEQMRAILTEPKNAIIKQYIKLFEMDGVKLSFDDDALDYIVEKAMALKTGARGLRSIVEEIMTQYMYDIPSTRRKKVVVTREYAEEVYGSKLAYSAQA